MLSARPREAEQKYLELDGVLLQLAKLSPVTALTRLREHLSEHLGCSESCKENKSISQ